MSTPFITNISPAHRSLARVDQRNRFSIRDQDNYVIRDSIGAYLGRGKAFWNGDVLPTENSRAPFSFKALSGFPTAEASIIKGSDHVEIQKTVVDNVKAIYEFGGLYSPWASGDILMASVRMKMSASDITPDGLGFSGVLIGLKADNKGVAVKFYSSGIIQMHDAAYLTTTPPDPSYNVSYDWDQSKEHTYYLLWHPEIDRIRLYASSDPSSDTPDTLLIDGNWSDFSTLPVDEIPVVQPVLYFGHGYTTPLSISRWYAASIYNKVETAIVGGYFPGDHLGFLESDESVDHRPLAKFEDSAHSWMKISGSSGSQVVTPEFVELLSDKGNSFGFYRKEPKLQGSAFLLDVEFGGSVRIKDSGDSSGMELFIDDGVRHTRLCLMYFFGTQALGIFIGTQPNDSTHYSLYSTGWGAFRDYRVLVDPSANVRVISVETGPEGVVERTLLSVPYAGLPPTAFVPRSLGFLHNAASNQAAASLMLGRVRYSAQVEDWESDALPASPWSQQGSGGTVYLADGEVGMIIDDTSDFDHLYFRKSLPTLTSGYGIVVEFLHRISSFGFSGLENPIRENTGVGVRVQDGTNQVTLLFADAGPTIGKIVFIATMSDYEANLLAIRSGDALVEGTYAVVDWSSYHLYRLERGVTSGFKLFLDNSKKHSLSIENWNIDLPLAIGGFQGIEFGSLMNDHTSKSQWHLLRNSTSSGYDGEVYPIPTDEALLDRYDSSLVCLVEAESP